MFHGDDRVKNFALAAGAVGSSYDAEAFVAARAFQEFSKLTIASGSTIRLFADCRSCIDALNGQPRIYGEMMYRVESFGAASDTAQN